MDAASDRTADASANGDRRWRRGIFPGLLVGFAALYAWRMSGIGAVPPITDHLSNAYLSGAALTLLAGPAAFTLGPPRPRLAIAAAALVALNVGAELLATIGDLDEVVNDVTADVNTADPLDGVFGLAAIAAVLALVRWRPAGPTSVEV